MRRYDEKKQKLCDHSVFSGIPLAKELYSKNSGISDLYFFIYDPNKQNVHDVSEHDNSLLKSQKEPTTFKICTMSFNEKTFSTCFISENTNNSCRIIALFEKNNCNHG